MITCEGTAVWRGLWQHSPNDRGLAWTLHRICGAVCGSPRPSAPRPLPSIWLRPSRKDSERTWRKASPARSSARKPIRCWPPCGITQGIRSMTGFKRADVVLVRFIFSDESGTKLRPALVVSSAAYHRGRQELVVAAITSNVRRRLYGDHVLTDWKR